MPVDVTISVAIEIFMGGTLRPFGWALECAVWNQCSARAVPRALGFTRAGLELYPFGHVNGVGDCSLLCTRELGRSLRISLRMYSETLVPCSIALPCRRRSSPRDRRTTRRTVRGGDGVRGMCTPVPRPRGMGNGDAVLHVMRVLRAHY